jgi:site-specific recombinase XerD
MPDVLMNVLKVHLEQSSRREPDDFVFSLKDGSPLSYTYLRKRILCPALDAAGIKREKSLHGFHLFRHSAATILDGETKSLRAARDLLGHSQESTTAIYTHTPRLAVEGSEILAQKIVGNCGLVVAESSEAIQ